jgi:hypothetical protein
VLLARILYSDANRFPVFFFSSWPGDQKWFPGISSEIVEEGGAETGNRCAVIRRVPRPLLKGLGCYFIPVLVIFTENDS